jgi:putative spermidine/putrescine transport system permease protein
MGAVCYRMSVWSVLGFITLPLLCIVWVSVFANPILSFPPTGYSWRWYGNAWATDAFRDGFLLSLQLGAAATVISLGLGVPASLALVRYPFPGKQTVMTVLLAPMIVPGIVGGAALYIGLLELEEQTNLPVSGSLVGLLIAHGLIALPWTIRLVTASLITADRSIEEAALNLGAGPWTTFRRVTLPMMRPAMVAAGLFSFVVSFIDLEKSLFLVGPGRTTLQIAIVNYLEWNLDPTIAAVATVQIGIIGAALLMAGRFVRLSRLF